jgi:hypothetical protein
VASPSNNLVNHFSGCYMRGSAWLQITLYIGEL